MAGKYFEILTEVCLSLSFLFKILCIYLCPVTSLVVQAAAKPCNIHCLWERMTQQNADKEGVEFLPLNFKSQPRTGHMTKDLEGCKREAILYLKLGKTLWAVGQSWVGSEGNIHIS